MATAGIARSIAVALGKKVSSSCWFTPHMAAAARAIADRIPLVDLVLEIRDARIPLSSEVQLRRMPRSSRRVIVLNKIDLANQKRIKEWMKYFDQQNCISFGVNAHNEGNIKELLLFLQAKVGELMKTKHSDYTVTVMLVGIPNVGKSALANSLHQVGRISAEEKGKLKHAIVSPLPGETKSIRSLKIGSHPNIYVLDTPGILSPRISDAELRSKLALIGTIRDCLIGEMELAHYFLAILYSGNIYEKWAKLSTDLNTRSDSVGRSDSNIDKKMRRLSNHTQDDIVQRVRRTLYETISSFDGNPEDGEDLGRLIRMQFEALQEAFHLRSKSSDDNCRMVSAKLLDLFRTSSLGHYILDVIPKNVDVNGYKL